MLRRGYAVRGYAAVVVALVLGACSGVGSGSSHVTTLAVSTEALPDGQVGVAYSASLAATGGTVPYSWALTSGALPDGLTLNATTGLISGTPGAAVTAAPLTFTVTDSGSPAQTSSANLTLTVAPFGMSITTNFLPDGQVGAPYSTTLTAAGGTAPYSWQLTAGTLPPGLQLDAATGAITGTPTMNSTATSLSFRATDSANPANTANTTLLLTISAVPLVITTTSLPDGQIGAPYSATLASSGGTGVVTWTLAAASGPLPVGLSLNASTGVISGTPTLVSVEAPVTIVATDSGSPVQTTSAAYTITVNPSGTTVDVSPRRAAVTVTQPLTLVASTNDGAGVRWSVTPAGGSFSPTTSLNGANVTYTAPTVAGVYTVTATSISDATRSASLTVAVTDLAGVYTYHNDLARDGANTHEFALTSGTVNTSTFGKLFSCVVDGAIYTQPLWVANLTISGVRHNVVFVATEHDSLYAFDADATTCTTLWSVSLIDTSHGGSGTETTVPSGASGYLVGYGLGDITPEVGVTGTPVIDPATNILYVVSKSVDASQTIFYQRLHAINITTGAEVSSGSPIPISATAPTAAGGTVTFSARNENQRAALALSGGTVWVAWASHEDKPTWYGWLLGYTYSSGVFNQTAVFNTAPNQSESGIWMSGGAPSADANGHLYVITGNGQFAAGSDYGDTFLQLTPGAAGGISVSSYFNELTGDINDDDFGAGGAALVLNLTSSGSGPAHLVVGGGKDGSLHVLNGDSMGGSGSGNAYQVIGLGHGIFATGAFWNNTLYLAPVNGSMLAYAFNPTTLLFGTTAASQSSNPFGFPGASASVSASSASANGIVWAINSHNYCTPQSGGCGPAQLYAYAAGALGTQLWNSTTIGSDAAGYAVKFTVPTIANGKVYIGTRGNNIGAAYGSTSKSGELDVYGLKPN